MNHAAMFCSTIIPTVNRPTLSRAVCSVLSQHLSGGEFEVIIVNDSGVQLPDMEWQRSPRVRVTGTHRRERSVARNTGAGIARGKYLHFLDDDDVLLPGALEAFWRVSKTTKADWLYAYWQTADNAGTLVDEFRPGLDGNIFALLVAGEGIPLQSSLVRADAFFEAGGFDSSSVILGVEDRDLGRRLALSGAIACVPHVAAQIRIGEGGSTTCWSTLAESDRRAREKALGEREAFQRLRASATSSYWQGRVCRALFGSMVWNARRLNLLTATQRIMPGLLMSSSMLSPDFWRGVRGMR